MGEKMQVGTHKSLLPLVQSLQKNYWAKDEDCIM